MSSLVTLPLSELKVCMEHHAHVAIEFSRGSKWSEFIYFESEGPCKGRTLTTTFKRDYYRNSDTPIDRAALSFLRAYKRAYAPEHGLFEIIMEIYIMSVTDSSPKGLQSLATAELLKVYNDLAAAAGKPPLKGFKQGKTALLERIEALQADASAPTAAQEAAKASNAAKAEKRLAGLASLKPTEESDMTTATKKTAASKAVKPAAKPVAKPSKGPTRPTTAAVVTPKRSATAKPTPVAAKKAVAAPVKAKAQGIGSFCMELIRKGKDNAAVLEAVKAKFPDASTSPSSIAWYRNKLKSEE